MSSIEERKKKAKEKDDDRRKLANIACSRHGLRYLREYLLGPRTNTKN